MAAIPESVICTVCSKEMWRLQDKNTNFNLFLGLRYHDKDKTEEFNLVVFRCFNCEHIELFDPSTKRELFGIQKKNNNL